MVEDSIDAPTHQPAQANRLGPASMLRTPRQKLPASVYEQLNRRLYHSPWPAVNTAAAAVIIAAVAGRVLAPGIVAAWLALALSVSLARFVTYQLYRRLPPVKRADRCWSNTFVWLMVAHGLCLRHRWVCHVPHRRPAAASDRGDDRGRAGCRAWRRSMLRICASSSASSPPPSRPSPSLRSRRPDTLHMVAALLLTLLGVNLVIIGRNSHHSHGPHADAAPRPRGTGPGIDRREIADRAGEPGKIRFPGNHEP
ncbi:MAG: hypothetical protein WDN69_02475 [Aliidongia sp.]